MSRTDVHRPYRVQVADPYARKHFYLFQSWPHRHELWPLRNTCGCRLCTGHHGRRAERRRERHQGKAEIRRMI